MTRGERGREKVGEGARGVRREKGGASRGRGEGEGEAEKE